MVATVLDIDSHEMIPAHLMPDAFGPVGARFCDFLERRQERVRDFSANSMVHPGVCDDREIDAERVWNVKGVEAPSAIDIGRREAVLDVMGIERQLVFPTFGLAGLVLSESSEAHYEAFFGDTPLGVERRDFGRQMVRASNRWIVDQLEVNAERVRVVAIVPNSSTEEMIREARELIDGGARALWLSAALPPGGTSPADEALDPLWRAAACNDVPIVLHVGTEFGFIDSRWRNSPAFVSRVTSVETPVLDVYTMSTLHYAVENFLTAMVLGGVFERFPTLRFGIIECTASWIGPAARRMDLVSKVMKPARPLPKQPSEYIARNVRVTPFWFEPIDQYFRDYPDLADVYCYSTDYPHVEGGSDSKNKCLEMVAPLGEEITRKFFYDNATLLLP